MAAQFLQFTDEQKAAAQQLDPSLEALLREVNLNEELIMAFRVQEITDRGARPQRKPLVWTPRKVSSRNANSLRSSRQTAKVHNQTEVRVDAVARAQGES